MNETSLTPMPGWMIVKPAVKTSASGLYLPSSSGEQPQYGTVIAVGGRIDRTDEKFEKIVIIKEGDTVHFSKWNGMAVKVGDEDFLFMKYSDILAIQK